ncbi:Hpt domain-containing protein [Massilia sp. METH4]|uniref:Hpt domain-containing protein n=1 Tax=Massilia sp. METH4 TaxID=3123041 RepID=UPI0030D5EEDD
MSETDFATHSFDPGPLSWVMGEVREALGRSRTALFEAGGLEPEFQATALRLAKSHLQQAHGALQMVDVQGVSVITQLAEEALDRFKDGSVKCSADHVQAIARLYGALVEYLEELLDGAPPQPVRLFPYYAAVQRMLGGPRIHPADLFFPDLAREPELPAPAGAPIDVGALRQRFERALLPYLKSGDPVQAQPLADIIAEVAAAQAAPRGHAFWLALQAFAELVAQGHVPGGVDVKQLFGAANLQMRRLAQGAPEYPDTVLRDALFFVAAAQPEHLSLPASALRAGFALDGMVPPDYTLERYCRPEAAGGAAGEAGAPAAAPWAPGLALQQDEAVVEPAQRLKAALRGVERELDGFTADPAARLRLAGLDALLEPLEAALADIGQQGARAGVAQVRVQVAALAATPGSGEPAERDRLAQNVAALGFFADMLAQNVAGARERFAFDAAQGAFRAVPLRKIPGPESIPVLDEAVPAPAAPESASSLLAAAVPGASDPAIEQELLEIFIGEARETLAFIEAALAKPRPEAGMPDGLALLRRSFHTLKGSGRMVGLNQFADAAAALEKVLNAWLAEARPADAALFGLLEWTAAELDAWVGDLVAKGISPRGAAPVVSAAAQVLEGRPFMSPDDKPAPIEPPPAEPYVTDENATEETAAAAPEMGATDASAHETPDPVATAHEDVAQEDVAQEDVAQEDVAHEDLAHENVAREDSAQEDWARENVAHEARLHDDEARADEAPGDGMRFAGRLAVPAAQFDDYVAQAGTLAGGLAGAFDAWRRQGGLDPEALHQAQALADASGAVGFKSMRELAAALEATLQAAPATLHDPAHHDLFDLVAQRMRGMVDSFATGDMPPGQAELIAALERLRDELARAHAAGPDVAARLDGMLAPAWQEHGTAPQEEPATAPPEAPAVDAVDDLATRLDTLFADTYHALLADPPPVPERGAPLPLRPQLATQDESIDDLFDAAFDDAFAEPPLTQAAAPQLTLVPPPERPAEPVPAGSEADLQGTTIDLAIDRSRLESEVAALRTTLLGFEDKLDRLRQQLREVEAQAESHIASRLSVSGLEEFDPAELDRVTRLKESTRTLADSVDDIVSSHARLRQSVESIAGLLPGESGER